MEQSLTSATNEGLLTDRASNPGPLLQGSLTIRIRFVSVISAPTFLAFNRRRTNTVFTRVARNFPGRLLLISSGASGPTQSIGRSNRLELGMWYRFVLLRQFHICGSRSLTIGSSQGAPIVKFSWQHRRVGPVETSRRVNSQTEMILVAQIDPSQTSYSTFVLSN